MSEHTPDEDPDPAEPDSAEPGLAASGPAARVLYVPVRPVPGGCTTRFFRTPLGERTAVGFTSRARLTAALGAGQPGIRLSAGGLRALAAPLGVTRLTVDPRLVAPPPPPAAAQLPAADAATAPAAATDAATAAGVLAG